MADLKPCPFCGYALTNDEGVCPVSDCVNGDTGEWEFTGISCPSCAVFLPAGESSSAEDGIKLWNDRPALAAKDAEIARLREALEFIVDKDTRPYRCGNIARAALMETANA